MGVKTWESAYESSIGNLKGYEKRLKELKTWDKPLLPKSDDVHGVWVTWASKCVALENLIYSEKQKSYQSKN